MSNFVKKIRIVATTIMILAALLVAGCESNSETEKQEPEVKTQSEPKQDAPSDSTKEQAEQKEEKPQEAKKEETYMELKGRGVSDVGRQEPKYEGLIGFVAIHDVDVKSPNTPWKVNTVKQTGPEKFEETSKTVPHKTKVKVLEQHLKHDGWGFYKGFLVVESVKDKKKFKIDVNNFVTYPYWEKSVEEAVKMGPVIAEYTGKGEKPVDRFGEWVKVKPGTKVVITGKAGLGLDVPDGFLEGKKDGTNVYFDPESLKIVY